MNSSNDTDMFSAGIRFNRETGEVRVLGADKTKTIRLSPVNRRVLTTLLSAKGNAISRAELFDIVWPNQEVSDDALTRSISDLRAQLKPLANTSPLITTIPKVGYRWLPEVNIAEMPQVPQSSFKQHLIPMLVALFIFVVSLFLLLYFLNNNSQKNSFGVIILPTKNDGGLEVVQCLKQASNNTDSIRYLSNHAYESHVGNPYPFFAHEFGVRWFIESAVRPIDQINQLSINLIDARTGLVILSETFGVINSAELSNHCQTFLNTIIIKE